MVGLDKYYNGLEGINHRKFTFTTGKPKSFGQSLKDIFFPLARKPERKIVKVKKKPNYNIISTMKPQMDKVAMRPKFSFYKKSDDDTGQVKFHFKSGKVLQYFRWGFSGTSPPHCNHALPRICTRRSILPLIL